MPRSVRRAALLTGCALLALPAAAQAAPPTANASVFAGCGNTAVRSNADAAFGFPRGAYDIRRFADRRADLLDCEEVDVVLQSYLYDQETFGFWDVRRLSGGLRGRIGRRFVLSADPSDGFDVFRVGGAFTGSAGQKPPAPDTTAALAPSARTSATRTCFNFTVVGNDTFRGFPQGTYRRLNFFARPSQLNCNPPMPDSYDLLRSYLYDGRLPGWTPGPLQGTLADDPGCRFVKNGTGGTVGFTVWCDGTGGSSGPCVRARPAPSNCRNR